MKRAPFVFFLSLAAAFFAVEFVLIGLWRVPADILFALSNPSVGIVQFTDMHAGYDLGFGGAESSTNSMQNAINWVLANKSKYNILFAVWPGDRCQENTNDSDYSNQLIVNGGIQNTYAAVTNYDAQLRAAGITVINYQGNHENDSAGSQMWFTNLFPAAVITNDPYFAGFGITGDSRTPIYRANVSTMKIGFEGYSWVGPSTGQVSDAAVDIAYQPQTAWLCSNMTYYSNYLWINVAHFFVDEYGTMNLSDDNILYPHIGPGITAWNDGFSTQQNLGPLMCGHSRLNAGSSISLMISAADGHTVPIFRMDTQSAGRWRNIGINTITNGGNFFLHILNPNSGAGTWTTYTVNADIGQMVTNGTWKIETGGTSPTQATNYFKKWF